MPKISVVLGTRPEIVKLSEIIRLLGDNVTVVHTGQHYSANMSDAFFEQFELPSPAHYLGVGGSSRGNQIGEATSALADLWAKEKPTAVVVQGDTNAVLAGALAANASDVPLVHVEAGLRSFDRRMPEEHNRVLTDHLSDILCAPTKTNVGNLAAESITGDRVILTGNTVVEALGRLMPSAASASQIARSYGAPEEFVLATIHRPENVDDREVLTRIIQELRDLSLPVVFPMHPRTRTAAEGMDLGDIAVIDPVGYRDLLALLSLCQVAVSDSGGIQEEVSVLKKPLTVVRRSTERPEVLGTFAELVAPHEIIQSVEGWTSDRRQQLSEIPSPYGEGLASELIVDRLRSWL